MPAKVTPHVWKPKESPKKGNMSGTYVLKERAGSFVLDKDFASESRDQTKGGP